MGIANHFMPDSIQWMQHAIALAKKAESQGEVPVGALVVLNGVVIGEGYNQPIGLHDPTAHAEIIALRDAAKKVGNYRLNNATLYVTLEPCPMCVGAIVHARIKHLVFGATDKKGGAVCGAFKHIDHPKLTHFVSWSAGVLSDESQSLLTSFFQARRR